MQYIHATGYFSPQKAVLICARTRMDLGHVMLSEGCQTQKGRVLCGTDEVLETEVAGSYCGLREGGILLSGHRVLFGVTGTCWRGRWPMHGPVRLLGPPTVTSEAAGMADSVFQMVDGSGSGWPAEPICEAGLTHHSPVTGHRRDSGLVRLKPARPDAAQSEQTASPGRRWTWTGTVTVFCHLPAPRPEAQPLLHDRRKVARLVQPHAGVRGSCSVTAGGKTGCPALPLTCLPSIPLRVASMACVLWACGLGPHLPLWPLPLPGLGGSSVCHPSPTTATPPRPAGRCPAPVPISFPSQTPPFPPDTWMFAKHLARPVPGSEKPDCASSGIPAAQLDLRATASLLPTRLGAVSGGPAARGAPALLWDGPPRQPGPAP